MSNRRRPERRDAHGAPVRSPREIWTAIGVVAGVLVITVALLLALQNDPPPSAVVTPPTTVASKSTSTTSTGATSSSTAATSSTSAATSSTSAATSTTTAAAPSTTTP